MQRGYQPAPTFEDTSTSEAVRDHHQPSHVTHTLHADPHAEDKALRYINTVYITAASAAWLACSTAIILVNRHLMVDLHFEYPMAVGALGMTFSAVFAFLICDVLRLVPPPEQPMTARFYGLRIFPLGFIQAICMYLGNQLYLLLTIAFIEMCKATLPIFTMIALFIAGLETPNPHLMAAVVFTAMGCGVAAYGEVRLTAAGVLVTLFLLSMEATRLVMTQFLLVGCSFHALQGLKYIAPACVVCLGLGSLMVEYPAMVQANAGAIVRNHIPMFLASSSLGLCVNMLSLLIIKLASATTLKVLAAARGPLVVMTGVIVFKEMVTPLQFTGYIIALLGFVWYNVCKSQQGAAKEKAMDKALDDENEARLSPRGSGVPLLSPRGSGSLPVGGSSNHV